MTRQMSKTTVKKPARIIRQNAQIRAQPDFRPGPEGARRAGPPGPGPLRAFQAERMTGHHRGKPAGHRHSFPKHPGAAAVP